SSTRRPIRLPHLNRRHSSRQGFSHSSPYIFILSPNQATQKIPRGNFMLKSQSREVWVPVSTVRKSPPELPRKLQLKLFSLILLPLLLVAPARARKHDTGFLDRTVAVHGATYKYQVYIPENWT